MQFTDFLWIKLIVVVVAAAVYGFFKGRKEGLERNERQRANPPD